VLGGNRPFSPPAAPGEVLTGNAYLHGTLVEAPPVVPLYILVDVIGAVYTPGVVTVPADARVIHAIEAAGGYTVYADRRAVNGAALVTDGMQIFVPTEAETAAGEFAFFPTSSAAAPVCDLICLNAATYSQLRTLNGIGTARANNIIAHRERIGGFTHIEQLMDISGIGTTILENIRPFITVR